MSLRKYYAITHGEIDIVAQKRKKVFFIEVKTIKKASSFRPEENLTHFKLRRIEKTIKNYLLKNRITEDTPWQIDALVIVYDDENEMNEIRHIENINII